MYLGCLIIPFFYSMVLIEIFNFAGSGSCFFRFTIVFVCVIYW